MGLHPYPLPRAVLSRTWEEREECSYSRYCAAYGCSTGAKGSSLAALLPDAVATGMCTVRDRAKVFRIVTDDATGRAVAAEYHDASGEVRRVEARVFVVACQAIETSRLLLLSASPKHPNGLANSSGLVGRNLIFSTFGACWGDFRYDRHGEWLRSPEAFVHRSLDDFLFLDGGPLGKRKGGTLNFLLMHGNPISATSLISFWDRVPLWGQRLKDKMRRYFVETQHLKCEVFADYTPVPEGLVGIDPTGVKDRWGIPSARVRIVRHPRDMETARFLSERGVEILRAMGAEDVVVPPDVGGESTNLVAGTCRFGRDPATSVLDPDCRAHDVENLWVTDGSFMPTGGSVPYTFTIYANAFRVADRIVAALGGARTDGSGG
jgi:choline dehydrogenase-like flavoprotein